MEDPATAFPFKVAHTRLRRTILRNTTSPRSELLNESLTNFGPARERRAEADALIFRLHGSHGRHKRETHAGELARDSEEMRF